MKWAGMNNAKLAILESARVAELKQAATFGRDRFSASLKEH